jgi:hypothetical protein
MSAPRSEHHLIITRAGSTPDTLEVLLLRECAGWALPCIESAARRSADPAPLNRSARERLGLEISVLRCLQDGPADADGIRRQVYEAECHGDGVPTPALGAWAGLASLDAASLAAPAQRLILQAWLAERQVRAPSRERGEWTRFGWRDRVTAWASAELRRHRATRILEIEQLRVWETSCVLRLRTDDGDLYLKALPRSAATEPRLTRRLAETHPRWTAPVMAAEPERGWLLTRAVSGPVLMGVHDLARWTQAAEACARIQIDWLERAAELETLGCPSRSLEWLEAEIEPLLGDTGAMLAGHPDGLDEVEIEQLRQRGPALAAACRELASYGLPAALEHGDLWGENVIAAPDAPVIIDWEDAALAHPLFSPSLLLLSLDHTEALASVPDARACIREAYLAPWRAAGPARTWPAGRLEAAFDLAQPLAMLYYAVQFRRFALPRIETSWEVRTFTPFFLRQLLDPSGRA